MEIYTNNKDRKVYLETPVEPIGGSVDIKVYSKAEVLHSVESTEYDGEVLSFSLPFFLTHSDRELEIRWVFNYEEDNKVYEYDQTTHVEVVTPILPISEITKFVEGQLDDEGVRYLERSVRQIIQAHTGQFFGKYVGTHSVTGNDETFLHLPMRLISLRSVNNNAYLNEGLTVRGSGWFLESRTFGIPTIREDLDGWHANPYSGRVPIIAPKSKPTFNFLRHTEYVIDGVWGWTSVPAAVQEAARLLINDYACGDAMYRDRFLSSVTAADWRLQFHDGAFSNTGNVRANQLLSDFVLRKGWVIV